MKCNGCKICFENKLCFLIASVFFSLVRFFSFATPLKRKEMNVKKKINNASQSNFALCFLYHSRTSHYLLIIKNMIVLCLSVTPFSIARPSSLRKEGKSAVLDYWRSQG